MAIKLTLDPYGDVERTYEVTYKTHHRCLDGKQCQYLSFQKPDYDIPSELIQYKDKIGICVCDQTNQQIEKMARAGQNCPQSRWDKEWVEWQHVCETPSHTYYYDGNIEEIHPEDLR
jgi:hypothetical protein